MKSRQPTAEEFARLIQEAAAAPTYEDAAETVHGYLTAHGLVLTEDQWCVIRDIAHEKPNRNQGNSK